MASIMVDYRNLYLGRRDIYEEACALREAAERKYDFHERHGEEKPA